MPCEICPAMLQAWPVIGLGACSYNPPTPLPKQKEKQARSQKDENNHIVSPIFLPVLYFLPFCFHY